MTAELLERSADRTEAVRRALRRELKLSPLRQSEASVRLGQGAGYLANLFTCLEGRKPIPLRVDTLLGLLALLNVRPSAFLAEIEQREGWFSEPIEPRPRARAVPLDEPSDQELAQLGRFVVDLARALARRLAT